MKDAIAMVLIFLALIVAIISTFYEGLTLVVIALLIACFALYIQLKGRKK